MTHKLTPYLEQNSAIHSEFRDAHQGHKPHAGLDPSRASTGVVWTTERAAELGFGTAGGGTWANLGQGAPEVEDGKKSLTQEARRESNVNLRY